MHTKPTRLTARGRILLALPTALLVFALPQSARAEGLEKRGGAFTLNTATAESSRDPSVALLPTGQAWALWTRDGSSSQLRERPFSTSNQGGSELPFFDQPGLAERNVRIRPRPQGDFVVVWEATPSFDDHRVMAALHPGGSPVEVGTHFRDDESPEVAVGSDGRFVVTWTSDSSSGGDTSQRSVQARRFDSTGQPIGGEFQVNSYTTGNQRSARVSMASNGDFAIAWRSDGGSPGSDAGTAALVKAFRSNGSPYTTDIQANLRTAGAQFPVGLAHDPRTGDLLTFYRSAAEGLYFRRHGSTGLPFAPEFPIAEGADIAFGAVTPVGGQGWVAAWARNDASGGQLNEVRARAFDWDNRAIGPQRVVSTTYATRLEASAAIAGNGDVIVSWNKGQGTTEVAAQRFRFALFDDGFESGDVGAWSAVVP